MPRTRLLSFILSVIAAGAALAAEQPFGLNENHPYGRLTSDYESPHVAWANPYFAGPIRALVLAPTWTQRETVELAERLSLDYTPWMTADFSNAVTPACNDPAFRFFQPPPSAVNQALEDALQKEYDVVIVGKLDWQLIPARRRLQLLERVSNGTGLVYIDPPRTNKELQIVTEGGAVTGAAEFILGGVPFSNLPAFHAVPSGKLLKTAQFGKGRVVVLDYNEKAPADEWGTAAWPCLTPGWDAESYARITNAPAPISKLPEVQWVPYEYYHSLVAKAVVWAAGKESAVKLQVGVPASLPWPVDGKPVTVAMQNAPKRTALKAVVRDRHERGVTFPLAPSCDGDAFALPALPCGEYFVDVWAMSPGSKAAYTWASAAFAVTNDFIFGELTLAKPFFNGGDILSGTVVLPRLLKPDERLALDLSDNFGRLVVSQQLAVTSTNVTFSMPLPPPLTTMHRLEARLLRANREVIRQTLAFPVRCRRRWDDFNEISWGGGGGNNAIPFLSLEKLTRCDEVDAIVVGWAGPAIARNVALGNAWSVPYQARYGCFGGAPNHIIGAGNAAYGCMSHPTTLEQLKQWGQEQSAIFGPYGPLAWTHGDETFYSADPDVCWCEYCLEVFHNYLKSAYPSLNALNAEWKTAYADWKAVMPVTFKEAKANGVYAPWIEHCIANNRVFTEFYRKSSVALAAHDPDNRAGYDGGTPLDQPNGGSDFWRVSQSMGILQAYNTEESAELIRSFGRPDQLRGQYYGTYGLTWILGPNTVPYCHFFPWNSLFHGMNSTWFWAMCSPGPLGGYAPDLTSLPFFASRTEALKIIKAGVGKLLLNSKRDSDGIAVYFSETSRIADALYTPPPSTLSEAYAGSLADINHALQDAGLQYQYVSYEQVAQGELMKQGYKVFFMPHSRSISDAECKAIREFVQNGGVALADIVPAILNGHGTPQPASLLADLFPSLPVALSQKDAAITNAGANSNPAPGETLAKEGDKPVVVNAVGKGKTAVIGDMIKGYGSVAINNMAGWKKLGDQSAKLADLLARTAGIKPAVRIVPSREGKMPPTAVTRFHAGEAEMVGILRSYWMYDNNPYPATVVFPKASYAYDMIDGKYLGFISQIDVDISYRARLYALLPYRVAALEIDGPKQCRAGTAATFRVAVKSKDNAQLAKHGFRVEVMRPDGQLLPHYALNVIANNGIAEVQIPWALNDRAGSYAIAARDTMSGVKGEWRIDLTEAE